MFSRLLRSSFNLTRNFIKSNSSIPKKCNLLLLLGLPNIGILKAVKCEKKQFEYTIEPENLEHEFLIKQACTVTVTSTTQLLTVTIIAIQHTSFRLREELSREISLLRQGLELGEQIITDEYNDVLIEVRNVVADLKHNLSVLNGYLEYAERLATLSAEISYNTGNVGASDIICEHINYVTRAFKNEMEQNELLQIESLRWQKLAIESSKMEKIFESENTHKDKTQDI